MMVPEAGARVTRKRQPPFLSVVAHPEWGELTRFERGWAAGARDVDDPLPPSDWDDLCDDAGDIPIILVRWGPPPVPDTAWYAAHVDHHLREAVRLSFEAYGPSMRPNAVRWVTLAFVESLGLPHSAADPLLVEMERRRRDGA